MICTVFFFCCAQVHKRPYALFLYDPRSWYDNGILFIPLGLRTTQLETTLTSFTSPNCFVDLIMLSVLC